MYGNSQVPLAIGEILWEEGIIDKDSLIKAMELLSGNGKQSLGEILVTDLGFDRHRIYRAISRIYAFPEINLRQETIPESRIKFIKNILNALGVDARRELVQKKILPYEYDEHNKNILVFITPDPTNRTSEDLLHRFGFKKCELAYCRLEDVEKLISKVAPPENEFLQLVEQAANVVEQFDEEEDQELDDEELTAAINKSLLVNLFEGCLIEAVRAGASDIHILPKEANITEIHFRVDGKLRLWHVQENVRPEAFCAVAKDRTKNVDRFEWESAQDGFIQRNVDNYLIRFRVSILPIISSAYTRKYESIVIRILDDRKVIRDLDKLGFHENAKNEFIKAIKKPQGMVILTGPTGSGKSTTLVAALYHVVSPELNVLTVEDPVEYCIHGVRQIKINPRLDFDQAVRAILRHDPDIVMVGEMRDKKTAEVAIKLANTGHLTFTTLHTNDAASVVSRLYKMGVEPFLIAYAINLVVAQRLVRTLCPHCKRPRNNLDPRFPLSLGFSEEEIKITTFFEPVGCSKCNKGYRGRTGIHEALPFTPEVRHLILNASREVDEEVIRESAIRDGMMTLRASARRRVLEGVSTLEEVAAVTTES